MDTYTEEYIKIVLEQHLKLIDGSFKNIKETSRYIPITLYKKQLCKELNSHFVISIMLQRHNVAPFFVSH